MGLALWTHRSLLYVFVLVFCWQVGGDGRRVHRGAARLAGECERPGLGLLTFSNIRSGAKTSICGGACAYRIYHVHSCAVDAWFGGIFSADVLVSSVLFFAAFFSSLHL